MTTGEISGGGTVGLADPYPLSGKISIKNINLDPFLQTALHLGKSGGHADADGDISLRGSLKQPESIIVDASFTRLVLTYASVRLETQGQSIFDRRKKVWRSIRRRCEVRTPIFKSQVPSCLRAPHRSAAPQRWIGSAAHQRIRARS